MFDANVFAERLKKARSDKSLSQAELAEKVGVSTTTISSYEKSKGSKVPALDKAQTIAEVLGVSLDWLCGLTAPDSEEQNTIEVLNGLANAIGVLKLDINQYDENDNYMEISATNEVLVRFLKDLSKIVSVLHDDEIPEYLKTGLKNTIYEKYKKYNISQLGCNGDNNNSVQPVTDKDDYPF